jgi:hypothetical protein
MEGAMFSAPGETPLGVGGILDRAFKLYREQATNLWTIAALIVVPAQVLVWVIVRASLGSGSFASDGTVYTTSSTAVPELAIIVFGFLAAILSMGALSKCLLDAYTGQRTDWRHSLGYASERLGSLAWLAILTGVLLVVGYVLLIIPGIYLTVSWIVAVPVLMFEGIGGWGALKRSHDLVKGRWWATFGALLVGILLVIAVSVVVGLVLGAIASSNSINVVLTLSGVSRILSAIITYPVLAALSTVIYVDLRARKEGVQLHDVVHGGSPVASQPTPDIGLS